MMPAMERVVAVIVLLSCSVAVVSVLTTVLSLGLRRRLRGLSPRTRQPVLALLLSTPFFGSLVLAVWGSAPGRWAYVDGHCTGHASACTWHLPQVADPWVQAILLSGLLVLVVIAAHRLLTLRHGLRQLEVLKRLAVFDATLGVWRLPAGSPMAFTSGLWRPACFVSEGLLERLDCAGIANVCAHEQAHARRRDGLRQWLLRLLSLGYLPAVRRRLLKDWELVCEQACDATVARHPSERLSLAQTLVRVARLQLDDAPSLPAACHLSGGDLESRVLALLHPAAHRPFMALSLTGATGLVLFLALGAMAPLLHYWLEWI